MDLGPVVEAVELAYRMGLAELGRKGRHLDRAEARGMLTLVARERTETTLSDLARLFGRDTGTLSRSADRVRRMLNEQAAIGQRYEQVLAACENA